VIGQALAALICLALACSGGSEGPGRSSEPVQPTAGILRPQVSAAERGIAAPLLVPPSASFDGLGESFAGPQGTFTVSGAPADPVGDVGPGHYVQMVNSAFAVFDKASGSVLFGPAPTNTLFTGFAGGQGLCAGTNQGDGIVLYDALADRWLLSQYAFRLDAVSGRPTAPFFECIAVSQTPDPAGGYFLYAFGPYDDGAGRPAQNDYPKLGAWPDAYYATYNMYYHDVSPRLFAGAKVCALDRGSMLLGAPATQQCFQLASTLGGGLLAADLDGKRPPPPGSPGLLLAREPASVAASLQLWRFKVDWTVPASSSLTGPVGIAVSAYDNPCPAGSSRICVPQPAPGSPLDSLGDRLMHRAAYRNLGDHEALVATHTVNAGGRAGVRWYELRNLPGQTLATSVIREQQGTHAPDSTWRWMGSIAQDQMGDIAVGFSASSTTEKPSVRYAGRRWNDPAGELAQGEAILHAGAGVQTVDPNTGLPLGRWGDYSALAVDPADDCTFWYTNAYLPFDGGFNWRTRIGSFKLPTCPPRFSVSLPACAPVGDGVIATVTATDGLGTTLAAYTGPAAPTSTDPQAVLPATVSFVDGNGIAEIDVTFSTAGPQTLTVTDAASPNFSGSAVITVGGGYGIVLPPAVVAGSTIDIAVTNLDPLCNVALGYNGTATFSSSDPAATLPPSTAFVAGVANGLSVTFRTPGVQSLTVRDTGSRDIVGSVSTAVVGPPSARVTSPSDGAAVRGTVMFSADATVGTGTKLASLELLVDGTVVSTATASPGQISWDSTQVANGAHALTARAVDGLGSTVTSAQVAVTVDNTPPPALTADLASGGGSGGGQGGCSQGVGGDGFALALLVLGAAAIRERRAARRLLVLLRARPFLPRGARARPGGGGGACRSMMGCRTPRRSGTPPRARGRRRAGCPASRLPSRTPPRRRRARPTPERRRTVAARRNVGSGASLAGGGRRAHRRSRTGAAGRWRRLPRRG